MDGKLYEMYDHFGNALKVIGTYKSSVMKKVKLINIEYPYIYGEVIDED